ncbi:cellulose synthase operon protein YhjQ/BcsQ [Ornithinimicrobium pekingense]|uniref:Uncharacterized protein n=1 Tax=Ornithinimicrobium pekingense TaxID=384677 RepID=A0ABQ2F399_9MICO|nr:cellulose synthase operon protein YhjQ/BcsQ [Ornithinimicrobium pekingense]GGK57783.1 hypothetical protein GCM10011509_02760 [Ornithinimicrobium pekingense]
MDQRTSVVGLTGASGGLGTSTLAAAVAGLGQMLGHPALLVDLVPNGAGLDQLTGCAHEPGRRWPVHEEDIASLTSHHLPVWGGVTVLSQRGPTRPPPALGPAAVGAVSRLAADHALAVLDLPRADHPHAAAWFGLCDTVVLVAGTAPPQIAAALVAQALAPCASRLVLRPAEEAGLDPDDVAALLGLPLVHLLGHDRSVARSVLEQEWPGLVPGPVRDVAAAVLSVALRGTDRAGEAA